MGGPPRSCCSRGTPQPDSRSGLCPQDRLGVMAVLHSRLAARYPGVLDRLSAVPPLTLGRPCARFTSSQPSHQARRPTSPGADETAFMADEGRPNSGFTRLPEELTLIR